MLVLSWLFNHEPKQPLSGMEGLVIDHQMAEMILQQPSWDLAH